MMQYQYQLVLEVSNYKLSNSVFPRENVSKKYILHIEGYYRNKVIRSTEYQLKTGTQLAIPWSDRLDRIRVNYFYIDDQLKMELGYSSYFIPNERGFSFDEPNRVTLDIFPNGGVNRIGKLFALVSVERFYADEREGAKRKEKATDYQNLSSHHYLDTVVPGFRFRRLSKAVNWNKLRTIDVDRVIEMNDVNTVLTCVDDIALGDAAEEDCDPRLLRALHVAQFTTQYLLSSKKLMDEKKKVIKKALAAFEEEEEVLDVKLSKYRAREKAMIREMAEMDRATESYRRTLIALKPKLKNQKLRDLLDPSDSEKEEEEEVKEKEKLDPRKSNKNKQPLSPKGRLRQKREAELQKREDNNDEDADRDDYKEEKAERDFNRKLSRLPPRLQKKKEDSAEDTTSSSLLQERKQPPAKSGDWKAARPSSRSQEEVDDKAPSIAIAPEPKRTEEKMIAEEEAEEEEPDTRVKTFTSFKPIVVSRKSALRDQYQATSEPESTGGKPPQSKVEKVATPEPPKQPSPPVAESGSITTTLPALVVEPKKTTPEKKPAEQPPPRPAVSNTAALHKEMLLSELSRTQQSRQPSQDLASTSEIMDKSMTFRSSVADSTAAMSVDSLNLSMNVPASKPPATPPLSTPPQPSAGGGGAARHPPGDMNKTWTPSTSSMGDSSSMDISDPDNVFPGLPKSEPKQLANTFPPSARSSAQGSGSSNVYQEVTYSDEGDSAAEANQQQFNSMLMESYDSQTNEGRGAGMGSIKPEDGNRLTIEINRSMLNDGRNNTSNSNNNNITADDTLEEDKDLAISGPHSREDSPVDFRSADAKPSSSAAYFQSKRSSSYKQSGGGVSSRHSSRKNTPSGSRVMSPMRQLDEDDPFGHSYESDPIRHSNSYTGGSMMDVSGNKEASMLDIDASQSITIDFELEPPTADKKDSRGNKYASFPDSKDSQAMNNRKPAAQVSGPPMKSPYSRQFSTSSMMEEDSSDFNSSTTPSSFNQTSNTFGQSVRRRDHLEDSADKDDVVLLGTGKYPSGKFSQNFSDQSDSSPDKYSSDKFETDSLGGTQAPTPNKGMLTPIQTDREGGNQGSGFRVNESTELSPVFEGLRDGSIADLSYSQGTGSHFGRSDMLSSNSYDNVNYPAQQRQQQSSSLKWEIGRAPLNLLELATAIEVHISAVRLNSNVSRMIKEFYVCVEFLDVKSTKSANVPIRSDSIVQPLSFYSYMVVGEDSKSQLIEEISELRENLNCTVYVYNKADNNLLGQGVLELWAMIEHSCNILRQEANVFSPSMSTVIGSVVFDVKGYRLLTACANE